MKIAGNANICPVAHGCTGRGEGINIAARIAESGITAKAMYAVGDTYKVGTVAKEQIIILANSTTHIPNGCGMTGDDGVGNADGAAVNTNPLFGRLRGTSYGGM